MFDSKYYGCIEQLAAHLAVTQTPYGIAGSCCTHHRCYSVTAARGEAKCESNPEAKRLARRCERNIRIGFLQGKIKETLSGLNARQARNDSNRVRLLLAALSIYGVED